MEIELEIIKQGIGETPQLNDEVYFFYFAKNHDGEFLSGSQHTATRCIVGKGWLIQPLEDAIKQMKQGERAIVKVFNQPAIPGTFDLYEIEVIRIGRRRNRPWDLEGDDRLESALSLKGDANLCIKEYQYQDAQLKYLEALKIIKDDYSLKEVELQIQLRSNLSLTHLKNKEFEKCVEQATKVLEMNPRNVKLLHRRAVAQIELKEFTLAKDDLLQALSIDQDNAEIKKELQELSQKEKSIVKKEQDRAKKMLFGE